MKKKLLFNLSGWLLSIIIVSSSFAQGENYKLIPSSTISFAPFKKNVNEKVARSFVFFFRNATNLVWEEINKNYLVEFSQDDEQNRALFSNKGGLIYHIRYSSEEKLSREIRTLIKQTYFDQKIIRVLNVNQQGKSIWVVCLEDPKEYVYVRVENLELEETQRIQKN